MSAEGSRTVKLKDVCQRITVGHVGPMVDEYLATGVPFLRSQNIKPFQLELSDIKFVSPDFHRALQKSALHPGDVAVIRTGYPGTASVIPEGFAELNCADLVVITPSADLNPHYLAALFNSVWGRATVAGNLVGAAQQHFNVGAAKDMIVTLPARPVQDRLAGILSAYNQLIENSQRRIKILEQMARSLYREWFVDFRFPGNERTKFVDSALGRIPEGWEVVSLDAVKANQANAINGGPFGSKLGTKDYVTTGVPVIRGSNLSESGRFDPTGFVFVSSEKAEELRANIARPGDIVVTQRGTLGQIGMIPTSIGHDRFVISQSQMKITLDPTKVNREYAFFFLRSTESNQRIKNLASSSGVPHINLAVLREFQILLSPQHLQEQFGHFAIDTESQVDSLLRQIDNLRRTRDLLLPRLLSGQLSA